MGVGAEELKAAKMFILSGEFPALTFFVSIRARGDRALFSAPAAKSALSGELKLAVIFIFVLLVRSSVVFVNFIHKNLFIDKYYAFLIRKSLSFHFYFEKIMCCFLVCINFLKILMKIIAFVPRIVV